MLLASGVLAGGLSVRSHQLSLLQFSSDFFRSLATSRYLVDLISLGYLVVITLVRFGLSFFGGFMDAHLEFSSAFRFCQSAAFSSQQLHASVVEGGC